MPSRQPPKLQPGKEARKHIAGAWANYQSHQRFLQTPEDTGWALVALIGSGTPPVEETQECIPAFLQCLLKCRPGYSI